MNLGERIRGLRKTLNMTVHNLATASKISKATISKYENNQFKPSTDKLHKIAHALGVPPADLALHSVHTGKGVDDKQASSGISDAPVYRVPFIPPEDAPRHISLTADICPLPTSKAVRVPDDCLSAQGIFAGDIVIFSPEIESHLDEVSVLICNNGTVVLGVYRMIKEGKFERKAMVWQYNDNSRIMLLPPREKFNIHPILRVIRAIERSGHPDGVFKNSGNTSVTRRKTKH